MRLNLLLLVACLGLHSREITAQSASTRNVLLIVADDLRASVLGCYGDRLCQTPNIDRLAARGMVFEQAYCQGTVCGPSRASFMRGRYHGNKGVTLGEHFIEHGFTTARVGKIFHMRVPGDIIAGTDGQDVPACWSERYNSPGLEAHTPGNYACLNLNIFTTQLEGRQSTGDPHRPFVTVSYSGDGSDQPDAKSAAKSIELLEKFSHASQPFLLATGFVRPHYPMVAPQQFFDRYPHADIRVPLVPADDLQDIPQLGIAESNSVKNGLSDHPENQQKMWAGYYASVSFMDQQVGKLLDALERLKLADQTIVIFTSDHGYHLGEHTFWQKANLHEQVTRVPLIMAVPGIPAGRSRAVVELVDILPTCCELTQLPIPPGVEGQSLVGVLQARRTAVRETALSYDGLHYALRSDRWAFMRYKDGTEELYDMHLDSNQYVNLAQSPMAREALALMRDQLTERLARLKK